MLTATFGLAANSARSTRSAEKAKVRTVATLGGFNLGLTFSARQDLFVCNFKLGALIQLDRSGQNHSLLGKSRTIPPSQSEFLGIRSRGQSLLQRFRRSSRRMTAFSLFFRPNGKIEQLLDRLSFPNGLSLSADEQTLYVVQSTKDNVLAVPHSRYGGRSGSRVFMLPDCTNVPDGAALDAEGNLYVTCYASHNVYRVTPDGKVFAVCVGSGRDDACQPHECCIRRRKF